MTYEQFKYHRDRLESVYRDASIGRESVAAEMAARLGIAPRHGITPDAIKFDLAYRSAKREADIAFELLQSFNRRHAKLFAKEIKADIAARRAAKMEAMQ